MLVGAALSSLVAASLAAAPFGPGLWLPVTARTASKRLMSTQQ